MSALSVRIALNTGATIPAVGFGTVCTEENKPYFKDALKTALLDAKYAHIDTAWRYGTEKLIGETLKELFDKGVLKREDLFITTKVWPSMWNEAAKSIDKSLKDLQLDYVDLVLQHWPLNFKSDENGQPIVPQGKDGHYEFDEGDYLDTWKQLIDIYKNTSKTKAIGVSNYSIPRLERLLKETDVVPAVNQLELHPHLPQLDVVKFCKEHQIVIEAYSPLGANGAPNLKIPKVQELAKKYNVDPSDILINYHVQQGRVVLPRSQNTERIKQGYKNIALTAKDLAELDQVGLDDPVRYVNEGWGKDLGFDHWS